MLELQEHQLTTVTNVYTHTQHEASSQAPHGPTISSHPSLSQATSPIFIVGGEEESTIIKPDREVLSFEGVMNVDRIFITWGFLLWVSPLQGAHYKVSTT